MKFLDKEIPIQKLRGRTRNINTGSFNIGEGKVIGYTDRAVKMEIIKTTKSEYLNKLIYISAPTFFMSLSDEHIENFNSHLPSINLPNTAKFYEKK